jgi:dipeptidyl aminopeptidase/acylaminoacyl peptidase
MKIRKMFKKGIILLLFLLPMVSVSAQKKVLDHSVYDAWKSLGDISITDDGKFAVSIVREQEGDALLVIRNMATGKEITAPRGYKYTITPDQKYVVALIKPSFAASRQAKIKKTKEEKMPKDSLAIISLSQLSVSKTANVKDFKTGKDFSPYIAYTTADSVKVKDKADNTLQSLVVYRLETGKTDTIPFVTEYLFSRSGKTLAVATSVTKKDTTGTGTSVWFIDLNTYKKQVVSKKKTQYKQLALSELGDQLVFLATSDSLKKVIKEYQAYYYVTGADSAELLVGSNKKGMPDRWSVSEHQLPEFSKNGKRIFLGIAPVALPKDTTIPDFEKVKLNVWHWQDPLIQPQQMVELERKKKQSFLSFVDLEDKSQLYRLATEDLPNVQVSDEKNGRFALGTSSVAYRLEAQWDTRVRSSADIWLLDLHAHTQKQIKTKLPAECHLSPKGNYLVWYNIVDRKYYAYTVASGKEICLTDKIAVNFWNEKHDTPSDPRSYGAAAWYEDESILINDMYDLWKLDPSGVKPPENITKSVGRNKKITFRYLRTDPESRFILPKEKLMLTAFDNTGKQHGFYELNKSVLKPLVMGPYSYTAPVKAKNKEAYLYTKSNFSVSPDLYFTNNNWKSEIRLSDINPQMKDYYWGTAELIAWTTFDGKPTEGVLYKPENFDSTKKYPLMVYYYEKHADQIYTYLPPVPSRSIINISFYCSRGYIVFTPDIQYTIGHPGESAYNSIVSGVEKLCENAWIDRDNMALQGQSWGGYQTAYLITRTNMFKAAGAGAPVSNMFSAYGGIRWETGFSRQYQYEHGQSRIGQTIWEAPELYKENSPIFFADKVQTPLLMTHNDKDGAVPWYQGIEYFMALRRLQKPVWLLQYNDEAHNLVERRNSKDLVVRLQQFFDHYLKGEPMPVWMKTGIPAIERDHNLGLEVVE